MTRFELIRAIIVNSCVGESLSKNIASPSIIKNPTEIIENCFHFSDNIFSVSSNCCGILDRREETIGKRGYAKTICFSPNKKCFHCGNINSIRIYVGMS